MNTEPAGPSAQDVSSIVRRHRRDIERSPGVGEAAQNYGLAVCDDILSDLDRLAAAVRPSEGWQTAALLEERTRQAIRDRRLAGESIAALAEDYGVPEAFIETLCAWQFAAVRPSETPGWQPIETAPKDGRAILGSCEHKFTSNHGDFSLPRTVCQMYWRERVEFIDGRVEEADWHWCGGGTHSAGITVSGSANPTHWMPLPASPEPPAARRETR